MTTFDRDAQRPMLRAAKKATKHWTQDTVSWSQMVEWMATPADAKECGNYVLGTFRETTVKHTPKGPDCTNLHRNKPAVQTRWALTLDVDSPAEGFRDQVELLLPYMALMHTTYSSTPQEPRYRLIIPVDRELTPDEYYCAAGAVMQLLGVESFDKGSVEPERFMFRPSESHPGWFDWVEVEGEPAPAEELLANFDADLSTLPAPKAHRNKRDPHALEGTVGAFNRAYRDDLAGLIETYDLPYEHVRDDRWHLTGATASAGMGPVQGTEGLYYSHHANDPAGKVTCSAFDLVRLHLFGHLDDGTPDTTPINRMPSHTAMLELATTDVRVVTELVGSDFEADLDASADAITQANWRLGFSLDTKTGEPRDSIGNWDLIKDNDQVFKLLGFNVMSLAVEVFGTLPWREVTPTTQALTTMDRSALALYIEREYNIRPGRGYLDDLINEVAYRNTVDPLKEYLESLEWDGVERMETCLPGVRPTEYSRLVARKVMTAAVARVMEPGCKWDHMLVIFGSEGLGKSMWIDRMSRGFSAPLGRLDSKDTLLKLHQSWIMTSDEGHIMRQADLDAQKEFITRTVDTFRMPYDREVLAHPRRCVIWGTTNDEQFLQRQEGNRRFLVVKAEEKVDMDMLTDHYIDQVWAEAVASYRAGEQLWLADDESGLAAEVREQHIEETPLVGLIQEYLDTLVPEEWDDMSPEARKLWLLNKDDFGDEGTEPIRQVCSLQVWVEVLDRRYGDQRRSDLADLNNALKLVPGWKPGGVRRVKGYGPQRVYIRDTPED